MAEGETISQNADDGVGNKSNVELMMDKIIGRRDNRIPLRQDDRTSFLVQCRTVAEELSLNNKIPKEEVEKLYEKNKGTKLEKVFKKALENLTKVDEDTFYFRDFNQYDLVSVTEAKHAHTQTQTWSCQYWKLKFFLFFVFFWGYPFL